VRSYKKLLDSPLHHMLHLRRPANHRGPVHTNGLDPHFGSVLDLSGAEPAIHLLTLDGAYEYPVNIPFTNRHQRPVYVRQTRLRQQPLRPWSVTLVVLPAQYCAGSDIRLANMHRMPCIQGA
jgi:hypothetical protein